MYVLSNYRMCIVSIYSSMSESQCFKRITINRSLLFDSAFMLIGYYVLSTVKPSEGNY